MKRKMLAVLLVLSMSVALFGCSSGGSDVAKKNDKKTEAKSDGKSAGDGLKGLKVGFSQCDNGNSWRIAETESMQETAEKNEVES